ncbi:metal-sensing transcriptional repressor [Streptomyces shenzhenensis]
MDGKEADSWPKALNRLRRPQGQLAAAIAVIEAGHDREDVATWPATASRAPDRAGFNTVLDGIRQCLTERQQGHVPPLSEAEPGKLLLTLD